MGNKPMTPREKEILDFARCLERGLIAAEQKLAEREQEDYDRRAEKPQ
jgi:hypothetical protein